MESAFASIRDTKFARREKITVREHVMLCAFIAAAHARTPAQRDHLGGEWAKVLELMERIKECAETASPEQLRAMGSVMPGSGPRIGYEDVKEVVEHPMQTMLVPEVQALTPLLAKLDMLVLNCSSEPGFITSDHPCVWFDSEAYKRPPLYRAPALAYESIEISLPISPCQMILLNRRGLSGYVDVAESRVDECNRRTRFGCSEYFVSSSNATKPIWFDPGVEPEDSWRKRNPERPPLRGPWDAPKT